MIEKIQEALANMTERERQLLGVLGIAFAVILVVLPLYLISSSISEMRDDNAALSAVLRDIQRQRPALAAREATREAAMARYARPAPPLGSFMESQATGQSLTLREVTDQPDKVIGEYTRRNTRATLPNVGLRPVIKMLTSIENSGLPVALGRLQFEHFRPGDAYNVEVGLIAYQRTENPEPEEESAGPSRMRRSGRAGPPEP